jgi:hypothetical protein
MSLDPWSPAGEGKLNWVTMLRLNSTGLAMLRLNPTGSQTLRLRVPHGNGKDQLNWVVEPRGAHGKDNQLSTNSTWEHRA